MGLLLASCGDEDVPDREDVQTEAEQIGAGAEDRATELAEETRGLAGEVAETGREVTEGGTAADQAVDELREQQERARGLADTVREELPEEEPTRERLAQANEQIAESAGSLVEFAESEDEQALERARSALDDARTTLEDVAEDLESRVSGEAEQRLEDLQEQLPELPDIPQP